jgi:hypothetical protein
LIALVSRLSSKTSELAKPVHPLKFNRRDKAISLIKQVFYPEPNFFPPALAKRFLPPVAHYPSNYHHKIEAYLLTAA